MTPLARLGALAMVGALLLGACGKKAATSSSASTVKLKTASTATTAAAKGSSTTAGKVSSTSTGTTVKGTTSKGKVPASLPTVPAPATTLKSGTGSLATLKPVNTVRQATTLPPVTVAAGSAPAKPADRNCGDFANWAEAKQFFDTYYPYYGDVAHLDGDGDGIPCESLPGSPK
jgi:hypothetical protein